MNTDTEKEERLRRGYILLERTAKELASRFIELADQLEEDYPLPEGLLADIVDLTLENVVARTGWRPWRSWLMLMLEQRIRRDAIARNKKRKETIRKKKLRVAAEARRMARQAAGHGAVEAPEGPAAAGPFADAQ